MSRTLSRTDAGYRHLNITLLAVQVYLMTAPLVVLYFSRRATRPIELCLSMRVQGEACALCGWTRGLDALLRGDAITATAFNPLVVPAVLLFFLNLVYRSLVLLRRIPDAAHGWAKRVDLLVHVAAVVVYFGYSIVFSMAS